jgi:hypothetical protein
MGADPSASVFLGSKLPKVMQRPIRPHDLHAPNLALSNRKQTVGAFATRAPIQGGQMRAARPCLISRAAFPLPLGFLKTVAAFPKNSNVPAPMKTCEFETKILFDVPGISVSRR